MNTVNLTGNLATEVELREVAGEKKVASFLLAVGRGARESGADFVWVSAWDRQAELCTEYLAKGRRVGVIGRLKSRTWEQDGKRLVAYWIGREHWGKGIATRALSDFLLLEPSRPLHAWVALHNRGSIRVLERCGFRRVAQEHPEPADGVAEVLMTLDCSTVT